jgi:GMP reductase
MKFDFNDINLVPKKCIVHSRNECSTKVKLGDHEFNIPIIPANMECVIDEKIAINLFNNGYFYIMHRFGDTYLFMKKLKKLGILTSISIGVNEDSYQLLNKLLHENLIPDYITIDIAHGHSVLVEKMIKYLKLNFTSFIIAGNISTSEAIIDLESWGADATKVGIGPGSACTTYPATGFGSRNCQASVIYECSKVATKPIIADGGIKEPGDISKSLCMGATMIMIGGMLSGYSDSPGNTIEYNGKKFKEFWGSASVHQSNKKDRIEGKKILIDYKDQTILEGYQYLKECLQSSISYGGGNDLSCFNNVKFITKWD